MTNERAKYCLSRQIIDRKSLIITNLTDAENIEIYKEEDEQ